MREGFARERRLLTRLTRPVTDFVARLPVRLELKLTVAFLGAVALMILLGLTGLAVLADASQRSETLIKDQQRIDAYRQLEAQGHMLMIDISSALWMPGKVVGEASQMVERFRQSLANAQPTSSEEAAQLRELTRAHDRFAEIINRELALLRKGDIDMAGALQSEQGQPAAVKLQQLTDQLVAKAGGEMADAVVAARASYYTSRNRLIAFLVATALFGVYLAHAISAFVVGPLREIGGRLDEIARGEFGGRVAISNRDELGTLAENVNRTSTQLGQLYTDLEIEKEHSEEMLFHILPRRIVERMRASDALIADRVPEATILFSDLAGFTELSDKLAPEEVVDVLDILFSRFDAIAVRLGVEKIKTIGDGYMVAAGVLDPRPDHAAVIAETALAMRAATDIATQALGAIGRPLRVRIGINSGPLVAGVVGTNKLIYDIWGDTVNTASRMEKYGEPGRINVSEATRQLLGNQFRFQPREPMEIKGKGLMETYFLERHIGPRRFHNMIARRASAPQPAS